METQTLEDEREEIEASEARNSPPSSPASTISAYGSGTLNSLHSEIPVVQNDPRPNTNTPSLANEGIKLDDMGELLRSHENDIVNQVVLRIQSQNQAASPGANHAIPARQDPSHQALVVDPGLLRITELENQLARLRAERDYAQAGPPAASHLGAYNFIPPPATLARESASAITNSVEALFPGVERSTLTQIVENRFIPTNIYRLLAMKRSEQNRKGQ